ncbi:MAG: DUF1592 domain-containing protein [Aureliella sp.]
MSRQIPRQDIYRSSRRLEQGTGTSLGLNLGVRLYLCSTVSLMLLSGGLSTIWAAEMSVDPSLPIVRLLDAHCMDCHTGESAEQGVDFALLDWSEPQGNIDVLERALKKIRGRQMPPPDVERFDESQQREAIESLESYLDGLAAQHPYPGYVEALRRMTRTEYQNAVRDLLALEIDASKWLPADEASHGFDNITVGELSPTLMNRYVVAAQAISRQAMGRVGREPDAVTIRIRPDITQEKRLPGLPFGSRGGTKIRHQFPQTGSYEFQLRLARDRNEHVEGLNREHALEIIVDRKLAKSFQVKPAKDGDHSKIDQHLNIRVPIEAGPHDIAIAFVNDSHSLMETMRQPLESKFNFHRHPRQTPALYEVSIVGPYESEGPGKTPSRRAILGTTAGDNGSVLSDRSTQEENAKQIFTRLTERAFRRGTSNEDVEKPMAFYRSARDEGLDFEAGIERGLASILVSPNFLFRIESRQTDVNSDAPVALSVRKLSDSELASRLSFFIWSSVPDEQLLKLAEQNELHRPEVLRAQVQRMLRDDRASNLVDNFAAQWLYLKNLDAFTPDARLFPDFDDNLRQAFRRETELLFAEIVREDRSVLDLIRSDHTYLNERLAKHYKIPNIYGSHFRRVDLKEPQSKRRRGGILRHASILTVTSYPTRTSPVIRGNWILENLLGTPAPPPPANVPALEDNSVDASLPIRERLAAHRDNAACAGCHRLIDPVGFSLENFDAIGRWRDMEGSVQVDASGGMPDGSTFLGVEGLERALLRQPEMLVSTIVEKLMTFGIGRGIEPRDGATVRKIVRAASQEDHRFSSIVIGIVNSYAFQYREQEMDRHASISN